MIRLFISRDFKIRVKLIRIKKLLTVNVGIQKEQHKYMSKRKTKGKGNAVATHTEDIWDRTESNGPENLSGLFLGIDLGGFP